MYNLFIIMNVFIASYKKEHEYSRLYNMCDIYMCIEEIDKINNIYYVNVKSMCPHVKNSHNQSKLLLYFY